jgi:hypothetical protein
VVASTASLADLLWKTGLDRLLARVGATREEVKAGFLNTATQIVPAAPTPELRAVEIRELAARQYGQPGDHGSLARPEKPSVKSKLIDQERAPSRRSL